jgi:ComF family protein
MQKERDIASTMGAWSASRWAAWWAASRIVLAGLCRRTLDACLPLRCLGCRKDVGGEGGLCPDCWRSLRFVAPPCCAQCGMPFSFALPMPELEAGAEVSWRCAPCLARPPRFDRARSVFLYDAASRRLILAFKSGDRTDMAPILATWLARAGGPSLAQSDLIAPVPLHRWRLFRRRYNQAALLALNVARLSGRPAAPDLLLRHRMTRSQGGLSRTGRRRNVEGAFTLNPIWAERVRGARVVLVDDVLTTGATLDACCRVLRMAGAAHIEALTLARVRRPVHIEATTPVGS